MLTFKHYLLAAALVFGLTPQEQALAQSKNVSALTPSGAIAGTHLFYCGISPYGSTNDASCSAAQIAAYTYSLMSGSCTATGAGVITCSSSNPTLTTSCPATSQTGSTLALNTGTVTQSETTSYTVLAADCKKVIVATSGTISLPILSGLVANFGVTIINGNLTGGANITLATTDSSLIVAGGSSGTTLPIVPGQSLFVAVNPAATGWVGTGTAPASSTAITGPGYGVGGQFPLVGPTAIAAGATGTTTTTYCAPGWLNNINPTGGGSGTVSAVTIRINVAGTSPANLFLASDQLVGGLHRPNLAIASALSFTTTATGPIGVTFGASVSLSSPALYWECIQPGDTTLTTFGGSGGTWWAALANNSGTFPPLNDTQFTASIRAASTFGTWPGSGATWTEVGTIQAPYWIFSFASIP